MITKNYTTSIKVEKTIMEIEQILVKFKAQGIYKEYVGERISALMFFIVKDGQKIPFKIPVCVDKARNIITRLVNAKKLPRRYLAEPLRTEQGERVSWRIIKDWIFSQLSMIEIEYADPVEIFLPYAYDSVNDKTVYQKFVEQKEKFIALEHKEE